MMMMIIIIIVSFWRPWWDPTSSSNVSRWRPLLRCLNGRRRRIRLSYAATGSAVVVPRRRKIYALLHEPPSLLRQRRRRRSRSRFIRYRPSRRLRSRLVNHCRYTPTTSETRRHSKEHLRGSKLLEPDLQMFLCHFPWFSDAVSLWVSMQNINLLTSVRFVAVWTEQCFWSDRRRRFQLVEKLGRPTRFRSFLCILAGYV